MGSRVLVTAVANAKEAQQGVTFTLGAGVWLVQKQDPHGSLVEAAVVVQRCADRQVNGMTVIEVTDAGDGGVKVILAVEDAVKHTLCCRNLLYFINFCSITQKKL